MGFFKQVNNKTFHDVLKFLKGTVNLLIVTVFYNTLRVDC